MKQNYLGLMGLAVACSLAPACGNDPDQATEADYDDVAQALSSTVATSNGGGDIVSLHDSVTIALGAPSLDISVDASGDFVGNRLGLKYDYSVDCKDASGARLDRCGSDSDSAAVTVAWSGELVSSNLSAKVSRDGKWDLTRIQSGTVAIGGEGHFDVDVEMKALLRDVARQYTLSYDAQYDDVQIKLLPPGLVGGSVSYSVLAERKASGPRRDSAASFEMTAELTFSDGPTAMLTLDGKYQYAVDTNSGLVTKMGSVSVDANAKP